MGINSAVEAATPLLDRINSPSDLRKLTDRQLARLADELRQDTISSVAVTGGHLGSSLGVVELTVAIHAVFDTPRDKLIWDVGHQCYPHKILTGRRDRMHTLRKEGGLSGFTRRAESEYDPFGAAHSSTSISAGLGFAAARDLGGDPGDVVCVIGDGAMSAGMAYEAMNNAGALGKRLFVILNDNDMSIAPSVGAFSDHLLSLCAQTPFASVPEIVERLSDIMPEPFREGSKRARRAMSELMGGTSFFDHLGMRYLGPVDGHDVAALLPVLRSLRAHAEGPILLHAVTKKGAGYEPAETAADKYHGVSAFNIASGEMKKTSAAAPSYTKVFSQSLIAEAEHDPSIVAISAAMPAGTGVDAFIRRFPQRGYDVGIAEQHAVTFAAGLAAGGMRPFCAIYSTFLQRAYDQIVHDVALQGLPVRFAIDRAGLVGADGPTHAGAYDIGYLSSLPGFTVMAAADEVELMHMVATAAQHDDGPIAFRYPRGEGRGLELPERGTVLPIGRGRVLKEGRTVALLSYGTRLGECEIAAAELEAMGLSTTIADARFCKPLDTELLEWLVNRHEVVVTIEEGARGGFSSAVMHHMAEAGWLDGRVNLRAMTLPDRVIQQASPEAMYRDAGLAAEHIVAEVGSALGLDANVTGDGLLSVSDRA